jgi:hypothetical protein
VLLFPLALVLGVLAGTAAGGSLRGLVSLRLRAPAVPLVALVAQAVLAAPATAALPAPARVAVLGASYAAIGGWLAFNLAGRTTPIVTGLCVTGVGWLLNMCVVLANAGMPVSASALNRLGLGTGALAGGGPLGKHVQLASTSALGALGDTIPIPVLHSIVSVGDIVMLAGLILTIAAAMHLARSALHPVAAD